MHDSDRYELVRDIGSGNFGIARLMQDKQTKELVAVKYIERGDKIDEHVKREIINHRSLRHPNIVRFKEVILTPTHLAIVMEYASGGELFERICNAGRFSEDEARFFFQQFICGVSYCHAMQVCHRDLKLENTLLDGSPAPRLKICDFGYSKENYRVTLLLIFRSPYGIGQLVSYLISDSSLLSSLRTLEATTTNRAARNHCSPHRVLVIAELGSSVVVVARCRAHFPANNPQLFEYVHRVFGASNVGKILNELPPSQREEAVKSLAFEAEARLCDPVYGCTLQVCILQKILRQRCALLANAKRELSAYINPQAIQGPFNLQEKPLSSPAAHVGPPCSPNVVQYSPILGPSYGPDVVRSSAHLGLSDDAPFFMPAMQHNGSLGGGGADPQLDPGQQELLEAQQLAATAAIREQQQAIMMRNYVQQQQQEYLRHYAAAGIEPVAAAAAVTSVEVECLATWVHLQAVKEVRWHLVWVWRHLTVVEVIIDSCNNSHSMK
ncbi:hypothetical protein HN51_020002 [Arachis hypogaea]